MTKVSLARSAEVAARHQKFMPGGVSSINRLTNPPIIFEKAEGAHLWDVDGNRYIDYHAAFGPHFLGHNPKHIIDAFETALRDGASLFGVGGTILEGCLAELLCTHIAAVESVAMLNSGSEADAAAIRLCRAVTRRDHIIVMQGGYNGNSDSLACNVMNSLEEIGPRVSPGEYRFMPLGAGTTIAERQYTHIVNFNDLESVRYVLQRYPVAALVTEPVLQNIGVVLPQPGYLEGLRDLANKHGFVLIFDEVKTGFRHALGGFSEISGVRPDLVVYGKAIASGFPIAVLAGKKELMDCFVHDEPKKRPLLSGTYNGHPVPVAAAIATVEYLAQNKSAVYSQVECLGRMMQEGLEAILSRQHITGVVARRGSAFALYFMDHLPRDWHDLLTHHDFEADRRMRTALIRRGIYTFPVPTKQWSISAAHSEEDIALTLQQIGEVLATWPTISD